MVFGASFCTHQQKSRNVNSSENPKDWQGPKIVQTPAGQLYVYHKVIDNEPAQVTYVNVKYICQGSDLLKDWKRFKVQWFYGVEKVLSGSIIPLVYDPIAELHLSDKAPPVSDPKDTKKTIREEFNLETRCQRDQKQ